MPFASSIFQVVGLELQGRRLPVIVGGLASVVYLQETDCRYQNWKKFLVLYRKKWQLIYFEDFVVWSNCSMISLYAQLDHQNCHDGTGLLYPIYISEQWTNTSSNHHGYSEGT